MKNDLKSIIEEIISEQAMIVGRKIAEDRARATEEIEINNGEIFLKSNNQNLIEKLIKSYKEIFGEASEEVCLEILAKHHINLKPIKNYQSK